jgi:hypothetical protein
MAEQDHLDRPEMHGLGTGGLLWTLSGGVAGGAIAARREAADHQARPIRRLQLRPDQRQPPRLRPRRPTPIRRRPCVRPWRDPAPAVAARLRPPHRRHHPSVARTRSSTTPPILGELACRSITCPASMTCRTTAPAPPICAATAKGRHAQGGGWYSFDPAASTSSASSTSSRAQGRRPRPSRPEQLEWLRGRPEAGRGAPRRSWSSPRAAVDGLSRMGLGHGRRAAGAGHAQRASAR